MSRLTIALISPEIAPFAKTGGLADMVSSLAVALSNLNAKPLLFLPKYKKIPDEPLEQDGELFQIPGKGGNIPVKVWQGNTSQGLSVFFIDIPKFFDRLGFYGEKGIDYPDNCARFAAFSRAVLEFLKARQLECPILHVHDWQTSLLPIYLKTLYAQDPFFRNTRSLLTIHNLGYQGLFPSGDFGETGLDSRYFNPILFEFFGRLNLLKGGILSADALTTVSPGYSREILTPEFGCGLEGVLKNRQHDLHGVLNGIDGETWNPLTDAHLPHHYSPENLNGKGACKLVLQKEMNLPPRHETPLMGLVSRLVDQKGIDLLVQALPSLIDRDIQWVFLGEGDPRWEGELRRLGERYPEKVAVTIGFDTALSHRITAGADFILMPSRYEPCGYNQLYGMRYGTIPLARAVGGLRDTVKDVGRDPEGGTGILFENFSVEDLQGALLRALEVYQTPSLWRALQERAMFQDFSWKVSAKKYLEIYGSLSTRAPSPLPVS